MRLLGTIVVYCVSLAVVAVLAFVVVIVLAGPHAGLLPGPVEALILMLGWLAVIVLPLWAARKFWRVSGTASPHGKTK